MSGQNDEILLLGFSIGRDWAPQLAAVGETDKLFWRCYFEGLKHILGKNPTVKVR